MGKKRIHNHKQYATNLTDLEKEELKGPVQKIKQICYKASQKKGLIIQGEIDDEVYFRQNKILTFNENGIKIEERVFESRGDTSIQTFNEKGLDIEYRTFKEDGTPQSYAIKEYNDQDNTVTSTHHFYPNQTLSSKSIWKNNAMGKPIEFIQYTPIDVLKSKSYLTYDESGFQTESKSNNGNGGFNSWIKHEKNDHGHSIKNTHLNEDGSILKVENYVWEYDSEGKIISANGSPWDTDVLLDEFDYEYDSHENWIKKTTSYKGKPLCIQLREINYFGDEPTIIDSIIMNKTNKDLPIENKLTDLEKDELKGPVHKVKQTGYKAVKKDGSIIRGEMVGSVYDNYNPVTIYNEKGLKLEEQQFQLDGSSIRRIYNSKGLEIEQIHLVADNKLSSKATKEYNEIGKLSIMLCFNVDGSEKNKTTIKYDKNGNLTDYNFYYPIDTLYSQRIHNYDERGFKIEQKETNAAGKITHWVTFKNDNYGNAIVENWFDENGSLERITNHTYEYDSEGKMIGSNGSLFTSNDFGQIYEYEYDSHGNWIKKTIFYKTKPLNIHIREINYFGEESTIADAVNLENKMEANSEKAEVKKVISEVNEEAITGELNGKQLMWLAEGSPSFEDFSALRYYVLKNNSYPSVTLFSAGNIEAMSFLQEMKNDMDAEVIHSAFDKESGYDRMTDYTVSFPNNEGYILQVSDINEESADTYRIPYHVQTNDYGNVFTGTVNLLHPNDASEERDEDFETEIENMIDLCSLEYIPQKPYIYMIQASGPQWYIKHYSVNDSFEIKDLDLNYGPGFSEFDKDLMNRFKTETKGLILLHGIPGTGKTYYIRHLLRSMLNNNKVVIYMPPNMVDHLTEPGFMTFISQQVSSFSQQGKFCVLLIEDAEPLLQQRQSDTRIQGVTNLLNMTDGLLNDMLKIQIICTFNVNLKKIDKALLRPGRLLARKEFKPLPPLEANILASRLGIKHTFKKATILAEIFSFTENKNTLLHGTDEVEDEEDDF